MWICIFSMFDQFFINWLVLLLFIFLHNSFYYHLTYFMFELTLAETPSEPDGAFWTLSNLFHIFNHCNPPRIVDIFTALLLLFTIIFILFWDVC